MQNSKLFSTINFYSINKFVQNGLCPPHHKNSMILDVCDLAMVKKQKVYMLYICNDDATDGHQLCGHVGIGEVVQA